MSEFRHECKFLINKSEEQILRVRASGLLFLDENTTENGTYTIRSLYFDDWKDSCFLENENGTDPRSKFRIRYYNHDPSKLKLEKKSKIRGMCKKESMSLTQKEYEDIVAGRPLDQTKPLLRELTLRNLHPVSIVTYERVPYVHPCGNVRITFDMAISASTEVEKFLEGTYRQRPILPLGVNLLEIKWDELLPEHIRAAMAMDTLQQTAFSKYYLCRKMTV